MNYRFVTVLSIVSVLTAVLTESANPSFAEDVASHLSLGHDRFTLATPDPKVAAPAVIGAKYGFSAAKGFRPYFGTGIAYSLMPEVKPSDVLKLKTGVAAQAGAVYQLGGNFSLSLDYKYMYLAPDAHQNDSTPQSIGVGVNIKF